MRKAFEPSRWGLPSVSRQARRVQGMNHDSQAVRLSYAWLRPYEKTIGRTRQSLMGKPLTTLIPARSRSSRLAQVLLTVWFAAHFCRPVDGGSFYQEDWIRTAGELKLFNLEELANQEVVSVSREEEHLSGAPASITVISNEDIRRSGATSLPEALRLAPNLQVARANSHDWAISARGFNNTAANKMLVMIDGRTIYTPLFAGVFWDVQDTLLEDIERIEVISGPGGALWGANAVNGVISIITKSARDTQGGLLLGGGGTELTGFGGVRYGGELAENVYYRVYGKSFKRDRTRVEDGGHATDRWHMSQGGARVDWDAPGQNTLTFQGDYYDGGIARPNAPHGELSGGNALARWTHDFDEDSDLRVQMYFDHTHRRITHVFEEDLDTFDLDAQHRLALGSRHHAVWGLGYRAASDDVENTPVFAFFPEDRDRQLFTAFLQDRITLLEDELHLTLGTKFEHNEYTGFEFQPNARLAWLPTARQTAWTAVSRAVRTPSRIDHDLFLPGVPPFDVIQGGSGFESEELLAFELGYRVMPFSHLALSVTGFYHDYDRIRSLEPVDPPNPFPAKVANGLEGETYGVEFAADLKVSDVWRLRAGYTHLQVDITARRGSLDTSGASGESHDADHHAFLWSMWDLPARFEFDAGFRYVSRIANQDVPGYAELDARLAWQPLRMLELSIVGQNMLHSRHPEFGPPDSRNEIERSIYGKVTWRF